MNRATFFFSIGRCGTQSLTEFLKTRLGPLARVEHEPVADPMASKVFTFLAPEQTPPEKWRQHWDGVEEVLRHQHYVETGWPAWAAWPWLKGRFRDRIQSVHLVRDPVASASSWMSQGAFMPPFLPHMAEKAFLTPETPDCRITGYREFWTALSPFEKNLWYWAEAHTRIQEWKDASNGPWLTLQFESLFQPEMLQKLLDFIGVGTVSADVPVPRVDDFPKGWVPDPDPAVIERHPQILAAGRHFGYFL